MLPLELDPGEPSVEALDAVDAERRGLVEGQPLEQGQLGRARRADLVHEAIDRDLVALVLERRERPHQAPRRIRNDRRDRAVRVLLRAARAQLDVGDALEPARDRRPAGRVLVPRLPDAAVGPQAVGVPLDEGGEVLRPDLFLALVQHAHAERELADRRAVRLDRLEPRHEVALVVGDAATEEKAVALGRLERRGRPLLERLGGLDVVVVVDEQRAVAGSGLADDRGRSAVDARRLGGDPGTSRSREDDAGGLLDADLLGRDRRLSDERLQLLDVLGGARANVLVEGGEGRHARRLSLRRNGRRARLALAELAARRERRHFDPALLAEVVHDAVEVLEGLAPIHLGAWEHVHAVAAVVGERRPRPVRRAGARPRATGTDRAPRPPTTAANRAEEHTYELQTLTTAEFRLLHVKKR